MVGFIGIIKASDKRCGEAKGETQIAKKMLTCTTMHLTVGDVYQIISLLLLSNLGDAKRNM